MVCYKQKQNLPVASFDVLQKRALGYYRYKNAVPTHLSVTSCGERKRGWTRIWHYEIARWQGSLIRPKPHAASPSPPTNTGMLRSEILFKRSLITKKMIQNINKDEISMKKVSANVLKSHCLLAYLFIYLLTTSTYHFVRHNHLQNLWKPH